mmetsp:Transcript_7466/g.29991  ORF Transcript_7466/g.29991 Transcript_7466/m.29991 type:complete len:220 (-) Transcript_7466:662-1321(-)
MVCPRALIANVYRHHVDTASANKKLYQFIRFESFHVVHTTWICFALELRFRHFCRACARRRGIRTLFGFLHDLRADAGYVRHAHAHGFRVDCTVHVFIIREQVRDDVRLLGDALHDLIETENLCGVTQVTDFYLTQHGLAHRCVIHLHLQRRFFLRFAHERIAHVSRDRFALRIHAPTAFDEKLLKLDEPGSHRSHVRAAHIPESGRRCRDDAQRLATS